MSEALSTDQIRAAMPLIRAAFPAYKGRKVRLDISDRQMSLDSYWSGGSRDYFAAVQLSSGQVIPVPQNGTMFDRELAGGIKYVPQPGIAIIQLGKRGTGPDYVYTHLHPADAGNKLIGVA